MVGTIRIAAVHLRAGLGLVALLCVLSRDAAAADLRVRVEGPDGRPVLDAIVEIHPGADGASSSAGLASTGRAAAGTAAAGRTSAGPASPDVSSRSAGDAPRRAVVDQSDRQFVPHVSAVERDTVVDFPNSDQIRHSIYSFSAPKTFERRLYRGFEAAPVHFDQPGLVVLGCNIHDYMLGYVYVLETSLFGVTDDRGLTTIRDVGDGPHLVRVRHPRLPESVVFEQTMDLVAGGEIVLALSQRAPPRPTTLEPPEDDLQDLFQSGP